MRNILLHIVLLICSTSLYSQVGKTTLSQNSILIGEKVTLTYAIPVKGNTKPIFHPEQSSIPSKTKSSTGIISTTYSNNLEIEEAFQDTIIDMKDGKYWFGSYTITAWDSGNYVLESPSITLDDSTLYFPKIELNVSLVKKKKGIDIYDIRESFTDIPDQPLMEKIGEIVSKNWWWITLLLLIPIVYFVRKIYLKNKFYRPIVQPEMSLKDRTLYAIDSLEKLKLWEQGKVKEHFSELTFILRSYLSTRYEINLLEKTSHETKLLLLQKGLHEETVRVISNILMEADLVKFAKSHPDEIAIYKHTQLVRQVVAETSPIEFLDAE